jgi:hypothetical protein
MSRVTSEPPLSEELEREFAGKWVIIRAGQVIKAADTIEELLEDAELDEQQAIAHLDPTDTVFY